jgi:adenylate cyclase
VVRVKGKDKPVTIYEPVGQVAELDVVIQEELRQYSDALLYYRAQDWTIAEQQFMDLQKRYPQRYLYQMYSERIGYFRQHQPGSDWDGVFTYETK